MRKSLVGFASIAAAILVVTSAQAQQTIKIGVILAYSGQFADPSAQMDNGIKLYMKQHGDTVAGKKIELIRKDTGGIAPDIAKRLTQELIVRDSVDIAPGRFGSAIASCPPGRVLLGGGFVFSFFDRAFTKIVASIPRTSGSSSLPNAWDAEAFNDDVSTGATRRVYAYALCGGTP